MVHGFAVLSLSCHQNGPAPARFLSHHLSKLPGPTRTYFDVGSPKFPYQVSYEVRPWTNCNEVVVHISATRLPAVRGVKSERSVVASGRQPRATITMRKAGATMTPVFDSVFRFYNSGLERT